MVAKFLIVASQKLALPLVALSLIGWKPLNVSAQSATPANDVHTTTAIPGVVTGDDGKPAANIQVTCVRHLDIQATTDTKGKFLLRVPPSFQTPMLIARSTDGSMLGISQQYKPKQFVRISIKPKRSVLCKVIDERQLPISDADVALLASHLPFAVGKTNRAGLCELEFPADADVQWLFAKKSKLGCDYYENFTAWPPAEYGQLPKEITLVLDGAQTGKVTVVDTKGQAVPGIRVIPWLIGKQGKLDDCNLSGVFNKNSLFAQTNDKGEVQIDWLPHDLSRRVTMLVHGEDYFSATQESYDPEEPQRPVVIKITRRSPVSGMVTVTDEKEIVRDSHVLKKSRARLTGKIVGPAGKPVADCELYGEPFGEGHAGFKTRTNKQGQYSTERWTDESLLVARATEANLATTLIVGPLDERVDLTLQPAATVSGRVREQNDNPLANVRVRGFLADMIQMKGVTLFATSDEKGEFTFRAIPTPATLNLQLVQGEKWHEGPKVKIDKAEAIAVDDFIVKPD